MDQLAQYLLDNGLSYPDIPRYTPEKGAGDILRRIIGRGVRTFVLGIEAVSSIDIERSLISLPEPVRRGWLDYPHVASKLSLYASKLSLYSKFGRNPHLAKGEVHVTGLVATVENWSGRQFNVDGFIFITGGFNRPINIYDNIFYKDGNQLSDYVRKRFGSPKIIAKYTLTPLAQLEVPATAG